MLNPVPCRKCGERPDVEEYKRAHTDVPIHCIIHYETAIGNRTRLVAILRWNWRQWREKRKPKGDEAKCD